ncbi:MAG: phosphoenolpyruvate synthase regulatory protein [Rhodospirillaceae bacterium]|nr:phosphoenolpyruvate synthase regulatory protein [Rhodospirillaceae bacterium]
MTSQDFHLHLVSDATGETVQSVARACLVQFEEAAPIEHIWTLVRNERQIEEVIQAIETNPGFVLFTMVNVNIRTRLQAACRRLQIPCISVLQPIMSALGGFLQVEGQARPGRQHLLDGEYFERISAMDYAMTHDDGQSVWNLEEADVVLLGVSRTSKTPTCIYLANRGIKAANIPIVPGVELPPEVFDLTSPLVIGLTNDAGNLLHVRRNRLRMMNEQDETTYVDPVAIAEEVTQAKRLFTAQNWPIIDISRRSIEETAAAIIQLRVQQQEQKDGAYR